MFYVSVCSKRITLRIVVGTMHLERDGRCLGGARLVGVFKSGSREVEFYGVWVEVLEACVKWY